MRCILDFQHNMMKATYITKAAAMLMIWNTQMRQSYNTEQLVVSKNTQKPGLAALQCKSERLDCSCGGRDRFAVRGAAGVGGVRGRQTEQ